MGVLSQDDRRQRPGQARQALHRHASAVPDFFQRREELYGKGHRDDLAASVDRARDHGVRCALRLSAGLWTSRQIAAQERHFHSPGNREQLHLPTAGGSRQSVRNESGCGADAAERRIDHRILDFRRRSARRTRFQACVPQCLLHEYGCHCPGFDFCFFRNSGAGLSV